MSNPKTILLYTDESTAGGVANYNHGLLPALLTAGWRTVSAQPANDSPMLVKQRELGVEQRFISYDPCTTFTRSFTDTSDPERIFAEINPDLIYFSDCCPISNIAAKHVAIIRKIPFVVISHSAADHLAQRFPACLPIAKQQLERARDVIAISQKNLDILHTHFGLAPNKGKVVLNGRPAAFFQPTDPQTRQKIRAELKIPDDGVLCFTSARFDSAKGYQHQFAAVRQLQAKNALGHLYFAWAGTGDRHAGFAQAIADAGLNSRIRLLGQRWDIAALLDASDLFVLTTMLEGGLPLSVMEAMAKGVATVVTSVSGIAGVAKGACQLLPDPNSHPLETARMLADTLDTLARNPAQRSSLSQAGRELAERSFRQETNLAQTLAILESSILAAPTAPSVSNLASFSPLSDRTSDTSGQNPPTAKEGFMMKPDFSGQEWEKTILAYIEAFSPTDAVGLILQCDGSNHGSASSADAQEKVLDVVRTSGKNAFADILLIENPADLVTTLRNFSPVHRLPFIDEFAALRTPTARRFLSALASDQQVKKPSAPTRPEAAVSSAPSGARRQLTIVDYTVQPYNIGDFVIYLMGSIVAAEKAGAEKVDICVLSDPTQLHPEPLMRNRVNAQNHHSVLMSILPLVELHPKLGSFFVYDSATELSSFLAKTADRYTFWPSQAALAERKYMYYETLKIIHEHHQRHGEIPDFKYLPALSGWAKTFFKTRAADSVPVTVNLRNNPDFHGDRNYVASAWKGFFERCQDTVPAKFIITCAASEVDPALRQLPNVVFAKDHKSTLLQDLALIRFSAFHLGSASGPSILPAFGTKPYHIFNCNAVPHIALYEGALLQNDSGGIQFSFAQKCQTLSVVPETAEGIWKEFEKIWSSRDWPAEWLVGTEKASFTPATLLA